MRALRMVIPTLALALGLAACGGGDGGDAEAAASGGGSSGGGGDQAAAQEAELAFYDCMREHGVDMPDPEPGEGFRVEVPQGDPAAQEAMDACQQHMPGGGEGPEYSEEDLASLRDYTACMRENGIDMPDPGADGALTMPEGTDPESEEFNTAMEACRERLNGAPVMMRGKGGGQ